MTQTTSPSSSLDFLPLMLQASELESNGEVTQAIAIYQEIAKQDPNGSYGQMAAKALETCQSHGEAQAEAPIPAKLNLPAKPQRKRWFANLPVGRKQLFSLILSEVLSLSLVATGAYLVGRSLYDQLLNQAQSEVSVMGINYNIKINQMGFGFRGQSDNPAIINMAVAAARGQEINPKVRMEVQRILQNEIKARIIEYSTLVGKDGRILVNSNRNRTGQPFDPAGLVTEVLKNPLQIKASAIVKAEDLRAEMPPLPKGLAAKDTLIRYTATPVRDGSKNVVGVLISGDLVEGKLPIVENSLNALARTDKNGTKIQGGYNAIYMRLPNGEFNLATSIKQGDAEKPGVQIPLPDNDETKDFLNRAAIAKGQTVTARLTVNQKTYTLAARAVPDRIIETVDQPTVQFSDQPAAILIRGTPETATQRLLLDTWLLLAFSSLFVIAIDLLLAKVLSRLIAQPIRDLTPIANAFARGDRTVKATVESEDEIGELANSFNTMADSITASENALAEQSRLKAEEAEKQRQQNERMQREVVNLLLEIEGAQKGDLTVQAQVTETELGSVADAFNSTIRRLRQLVEQVKTTSQAVNSLVQTSEVSVQEFSKSSLIQSEEISQAVEAARQNSLSIEQVSKSAQDAAEIARLALRATQEGDTKIDQTVASMQNIRAIVATASKKIKQLAESSQEISQIVAIITNISEKTNLLAFNASIEAARAGENGQGFRVVADEVRRLADRVTESTKEVQSLVSNIQQETTEALQVMETGTVEVVTGTRLVGEAKDTLLGLGEVSRSIDQYLQVISQSTVSQAEASQQVNQIMQSVDAIAKKTTDETITMTDRLQTLIMVVNDLQTSVDQFRLEKSATNA
ncbi:MAG: methyl-accepting chemotaxis protein [Pseudanabaenaceae cyanobacterium bins.68]|nr:methyl-accepting chemotaxis protein [Pseudanabaenaceae cyanobacterium bins.68]